MSAFGDLLKIVAIGAFFIATGPFGLTVGSTLATALRIGGMVLGYLGAVVDRPKLLDQTYSMALDPGSPLPVIYGRAKVSGIVDDWLVETVGPQKVLYMAVPFAHGSSDGLGIASVDEIWIDGTHAVTVSGDVRTSPYTLETTDYQLLLGTTAQNAGNTLLTGLGVLIPDRSFAQVSTNFETGKINITTSAGPSPVNVTVGGLGGTVQKLIEQKRYTCNGVVDTGRDTGQNLEDLKSSCRGNLIWEQGQYKLTIRSEVIAAPTVTLSPANILGEWSFRNAGLEEKWNTIHATYIDPMNGEFQAQSVQWPLVGTTNAYLAADNSFTNTLDLVLPFTNDQLMAQMTAQVTLNESRLGISCSVRCTEEALALSVGDKVNVTHPTPGWTAKPFWVTALDLLPDTSVAVGLMEYDPTAYDLATQADRRTFPATSLDSIFEVPSPGAVTITSLPPQGILIAWGSANYGHIDYYDVQTRLTSAGDDYITIEHVRESGGLLQAIDARARPGQTWDARVRVVNTAGWPSEWVYASQITIAVAGALTPGVGSIVYTGFAPDAVATFTPPVITGVGRVATGGDLCADTLPDKGRWIHTVSWTTTGADDVHYQIDLRIARDVGALDFTEVAGTGYTTTSSSATHNTGIQRNLHGVTSPFTEYAEYQVRVVRKSDGALMSSSNTSQGTITSYSDPCLA
jgi:hypothetical protein